MNYIVKNCPACKGYNVFGVDTDYCCYDKHDYCRNISDCLIKQTIEMCKKRIHGYLDDYEGGLYDASKDVLDMFDIEEVKE